MCLFSPSNCRVETPVACKPLGMCGMCGNGVGVVRVVGGPAEGCPAEGCLELGSVWCVCVWCVCVHCVYCVY